MTSQSRTAARAHGAGGGRRRPVRGPRLRGRRPARPQWQQHLPGSHGDRGAQNAAKRRKREQPSTYTVQAGDTPSSLADQQDVDLDGLLEANPGIDPSGLTAGQELELP